MQEDGEAARPARIGRRTLLRRAAMVGVALGMAALLAACGNPPPAPGTGTNTTGKAATPAGAGSGAQVKVANNAQYGKILVDSKGMTLYTYSADSNGKSACTSSTCLALWPPLYAASGTNGATAGPGVTASKLGVITRADNHKKQITYGGKPLYYYSPDRAPGQTIGEKVKDSLGTWYVVHP